MAPRWTLQLPMPGGATLRARARRLISTYRERVPSRSEHPAASVDSISRTAYRCRHILPDRHPKGEPLVTLVLPLLAAHAAFDRQVLLRSSTLMSSWSAPTCSARLTVRCCSMGSRAFWAPACASPPPRIDSSRRPPMAAEHTADRRHRIFRAGPRSRGPPPTAMSERDPRLVGTDQHHRRSAERLRHLHVQPYDRTNYRRPIAPAISTMRTVSPYKAGAGGGDRASALPASTCSFLRDTAALSWWTAFRRGRRRRRSSGRGGRW